MTTTTKLCPDCDKQTGIVPCLGCQEIFCVKHFKIHREHLSNELEHVVSRRNILQEYYYNAKAEIADDNAVALDDWNMINRWEEEMKEQIKRTADEARVQLELYANQARVKVEQRLSQITEDIQEKMERENFIEKDIETLNQQIDELEQNIRIKNHQHPQVNIVFQPIDWKSSVQVTLITNNPLPDEKQPSPLLEPPLKPKYPPSIQRKCHTCGSDTWQKECKCCGHTYCGWHAKKHSIETKKH